MRDQASSGNSTESRGDPPGRRPDTSENRPVCKRRLERSQAPTARCRSNSRSQPDTQKVKSREGEKIRRREYTAIQAHCARRNSYALSLSVKVEKNLGSGGRTAGRIS